MTCRNDTLFRAIGEVTSSTGQKRTSDARSQSELASSLPSALSCSFARFESDASITFLYDRYPRQRRLLGLKSQLFLAYAHPPLFLPLHPSLLATSRSSPPSPSKPSVLPPAPSTLNHPLPPPPIPVMLPPPPSPLAAHLLQAIGQNVRFDSIHITPPPDMPWSEVLALPIRQISTEPGFVFLWVGKGGKEGGLERGREALTKSVASLLLVAASKVTPDFSYFAFRDGASGSARRSSGSRQT